MKPFSMEPVLRYRQQLEDAARQKLFASLEQESKIHASLLRAEEKLSSLYSAFSLEKQEGTTVDRLLLYENRIRVEQAKAGQLRTELEEQKQVVARKRRQLIQASQDKKALEKLKEKQNLSYKQYKDKQEATMLDEIAVLRYRR